MNEFNIPDFDYKEEVRRCKSLDNVMGKNGLIQRMLKDVIQNILEAEMEDHLGREKYERNLNNNEATKNYRNGYSKKNIRSSFGDLDIDVPRDRNADFEPKVVKKYETVCNELDKKVISLYARGMSTRDIQAEIEDLYGITISPSMVSKITDKVMGAAIEWQNRILDKVYPIIYMDAMHFKVREDNKIVNKAAYICMAYDMTGHTYILGIWIGESKTASAVINEVKNIQDLFGDKFSEIFKTITSDNDLEFADLATLENFTDTKIYFTHPYLSFEKGTNERHNGLIRRFIPKGKRISNYNLDQILFIEDCINTLPRKTLKLNILYMI